MLYVKRLLDVNFMQSAMFFNLFHLTISCKSRIEKGIPILKMINVYTLFCVQSECFNYQKNMIVLKCILYTGNYIYKLLMKCYW